MKKYWIILLASFLILSCKSQEISQSEKQEIIEELNLIKLIDQEYNGVPPKALIKKYGHEKAWELFIGKRDSIHLLNQSRIKVLYRKYGYLGYDDVGRSASTNFWLTIQHADNDLKFQRRMLKALKKEIDKRNADKTQYAMLEDRLHVNLKKPQKFGTQITYNEFGQAIAKIGLVDSTNIDDLRAKFNLPPIKEYYNMMTRAHFRMNQEALLKKGIKNPRLYD